MGGLDECFEALEQQWPTWNWLRVRLQKAGLEPTRAKELRAADRRSSWVVFARPSTQLQNQFELAPEVLILVAPWNVMQANDVACVENLFRTEVRLDPGFVIVIAHDAAAETRLLAVVPENRRYLFLADDVVRDTADPHGFLRDYLRGALGARRLFDYRKPAAGSQFFGRDKELEALERDVLAGHSLGVFGLRKVGKTSLLRRVARKFREAVGPARRVLPIEVDLLTTPFDRRDRAGVLSVLDRALDSAVRDANISVAGGGTPLDRLVRTVDHVRDTFNGRVFLMLDEYESLLGARIPAADGIDLLTWFRGLAQAQASSFSFALAGRNPKLLAPARIEGFDNPMYRFLRRVPIAGLADEDCRMMVRKLGGRLGLRFEHDALSVFVAETGGHPALVRTLGDLIDQNIAMTTRNPAVVDAAVARGILPQFTREVDEDMRELVDAAKDADPKAEEFLIHLAHGLPWIGGDTEAKIDDALVAYGILRPGTREFRIGRLPQWLRENYARPMRAANA